MQGDMKGPFARCGSLFDVQGGRAGMTRTRGLWSWSCWRGRTSQARRPCPPFRFLKGRKPLPSMLTLC